MPEIFEYSKPQKDIVKYWNGLKKTELWSIAIGDVHNLMDMAIEEIEQVRNELHDFKERVQTGIETVESLIKDTEGAYNILEGKRQGLYLVLDYLKSYPALKEDDGIV